MAGTFGSLFSGVGGLDLGLHRAGWDCRWQVEKDPWRREVLATHWPDVPRYEDVKTVDPSELEAVDLIAGGFPCTDVSVAGKRAGLAGEHSGLFFEFVRIAEALRPAHVLIENVPGLLSSHRGRDFGTVLQTLAELGYGMAWRILDSRYFGVPQRRRRVFILGALPGGRAGAERAGAILAVGESCARHPAKGRGSRSDAAGTLGARSGRSVGAQDAGGGISLSGMGSGGPDDNDAQAGRLVGTLNMGSARRLNFDGTYVAGPVAGGDYGAGRMTEDLPNLAYTLGQNDRNRSQGPANYITHSLTSEGHDASEDGTGRGVPLTVYNPSRTLEKDGSVTERFKPDSIVDALHAPTGNKEPLVGSVRRLTPVECCRLQGFPDDWMGQPNQLPDSPRYAAMGDAVTVSVAQWLGARLMQREEVAS